MDVKRAVLLICQSNDANLYAIRDVLQHRQIPYYHVDITQKRKPSDLTFSLSSESESARLWDAFDIPFEPEDICGIWCRGYAFHEHAPPQIGTLENFIRNEEIYALEYLLYLLKEAAWVNPVSTPFLTRRGVANRLVQSHIASSIGLEIPAQIISNSALRLQEFMGRCKGGVINKQIAQGSSSEAGPLVVFTKMVDEQILGEHDPGSRCPILLQEYIDKDHEIRAVVIGDSVFAAAIDTASQGRNFIDSRESSRTNLTYYRIELDDHEVKKLIQMNSALGVRYSAMDLIRRTDGTLVFLEANPSGQWGFIEMFTGYPITERIVEELL